MFGGVERFLTPIEIAEGNQGTRLKKNAFFGGSFTNHQSGWVNQEKTQIVIDSIAIQKMLSEAIKHRFQVFGEISVQLSSEWLPVIVANEVILKIKDASPDELSSSTFIRFSLWNPGDK